MKTPFGLFDLEVTRGHDLSPSLRRFTFTGETLNHFESGGRDQSLSLFLPHPYQAAPVLPPAQDQAAWYRAYRAMPSDVRAVMRSYTVRAQRRGDDGRTEVDIEFALHPDGGPACRWAETAGAGDRVAVLGPMTADNSGVRFRPPAGTDWVLIWADETALPAAAAILEALPAGTPAKVWLEVPYAADRRTLHTEADAEITWLARDEAPAAGQGEPLALTAVRAATLPEGTPYTWIAGEAGALRTLRRHLVGERQFDRRAVTFVGYWRHGASEDRLREEAETAA
ncbi:Vibriobactin utilization protein ViuB [Streptomyces sp. YIM 130001]|uniref:siderophore-interacting protein n=1 Tax=Streptomyces sp. YIM 130001 TaxID=2259644 RepID=UPI000E65872C|nr:siderophore-interacting protein [Streptomyces sp. YIM 130001]RII19646.1 Vibriobactin utilization protein ViuB [Streptomyces sp. YIM 130001]